MEASVQGFASAIAAVADVLAVAAGLKSASCREMEVKVVLTTMTQTAIG